MRVLFWPETFRQYVSGGELIAAELVSTLRRRGHELIVVTRKDTDDLPDEAVCDGLPVYRFPFWTALATGDVDRLPRIHRRVRELRRAFKPDLAHLFCAGPSALFHQQTAGAHPAPLLVSLQQGEGDASFRPGTVLGSTLRSADWVTACSRAVLGETRRQVPEIVPHSSVIWNSLELPGLAPEPLPIGTPRVLCLGRMVPEKGFDVALAAFAQARRGRPDVRLVIAGDGPARAGLERLAEELGIADAVEFLGWVAPAEVSALINRSTMVVVPSRWKEPFGVVAVQAAQMARPVVATRIGGLPEIVVHGATGLLFECEDSTALARAIERLLEQPDMATRMGQAGRARALELFSWESHVDAYEALYRELVTAGGGHTSA